MKKLGETVLALTMFGFGFIIIPMGMAAIMSAMAFDFGETIGTWARSRVSSDPTRFPWRERNGPTTLTPI